LNNLTLSSSIFFSSSFCRANAYREKIVEAEKLQSKATEKLDGFKKTIKELEKEIRNQSTVSKKAPLEPPVLAETEALALRSKLEEAKSIISEVSDVAPSTGSSFVRFWLGQVNVKAATAKDRMALRDEYEKFKERTNYGFVIFPLVWILTEAYLKTMWRYTHWIHILTHVWLLYYYVSLSLRENILLVNGSKIRQWWIVHHYISSAMSIIVLTWPAESRSWDKFMQLFTAYFLYQGLVQFIQGWYQRGRHYHLRALGERTPMDVSHTETISEFHQGLYPLVFLALIAHAWQVYNGYSLLEVLVLELNPRRNWYEFREEIQCFALGMLFIFLGCTNAFVTISTILEKFEKQRKKSINSEASNDDGIESTSTSGNGTQSPTGNGSGTEGSLINSGQSSTGVTPTSLEETNKTPAGLKKLGSLRSLSSSAVTASAAESPRPAVPLNQNPSLKLD